MDISINYWGVLLAAVSSMIIGAIYYSPGLYGAAWKRVAKIDEKVYKRDTPRLMPLMFIAALLGAFVMAHFVFIVHAFYKDSWMAAGVTTSLWVWAGFSFTTLLVHNALDQRPTRLSYINVGNRLVSLLAMGLILGWLHP